MVMSTDGGTEALRAQLIEKILAKQDDAGRWGYDEKQARVRPEYIHYSPNYRSTLWTLVLLADLKAPPDLPQAHTALNLITDHFWDAENGIFGFPDRAFFPIPCLNGNLLYLHGYFGSREERLARTIDFFAAHQRFDDGGFRTPAAHPYCGNRSCYGAHSCFWGVAKLLKGLAFTPRARRSPAAQGLLGRCIAFALLHEVCFSSRRPERLLHPGIDALVFPNFSHSDALELLWLLMREGIRDGRTARAAALVRGKMLADGTWAQEKDLNTVVTVGKKGQSNAFITERAREVMDYYGW